MYKTICSTLMLIVIIPLAGCGQGADGLVRRQIDQLNELADAVEADAEQATIDAIETRMKESKVALDDLDLSDDQKQRLTEEYGDELAEALARVTKAQMSRMGGAMQGMMKDMQGNMPTMPDGLGEMPQLP